MNIGKTKLILSAVILVTIASIVGWSVVRAQGEAQSTQFLMDTIVDVKVHGRGARRALKEAFARANELEYKLSRTIEGGEVYRINETAGTSGVVVSEDTLNVLRKALSYSELSQGAFDPTILPLVKLWGIGTENEQVPAIEDVSHAKEDVDYTRVIVDENRVGLQGSEMGLDFGAIAKGYIADEMAKVLRDSKVEHALLSLGGNIYALGTSPDGSPWRIGISDPRGVEGEYFCVVELVDSSLVTSGDYQRFFVKDGNRYHHIIDPNTGYPAESDCISTTVLAPVSADADALSTSIFVMGSEKGLRLVESLEGIEAVVVTKDKRVLVSSGLRGKLHMRSEEYVLNETGR